MWYFGLPPVTVQKCHRYRGSPFWPVRYRRSGLRVSYYFRFQVLWLCLHTAVSRKKCDTVLVNSGKKCDTVRDTGGYPVD